MMASGTASRYRQRATEPVALQVLEQFFQLFTGAVVVLGDGEFQGVVEDGFGFWGTTEGNEGFAELDVDDHPVRFLVAQGAEMFDGVGELVRVAVRLGEVESGQVVVGEFLPQLQRFRNSVGTHSSTGNLSGIGEGSHSRREILRFAQNDSV